MAYQAEFKQRAKEGWVAPISSKHGTVYTYRMYGCRCDLCTARFAEFRRSSDISRAAKLRQIPDDDARHGTVKLYRYGCRCAACAQAMSVENHRRYDGSRDCKVEET